MMSKKTIVRSARQNQTVGFNASAEDSIAVSLPWWESKKFTENGHFLGVTEGGSPFFYNPFEWMSHDLCPNLLEMHTAKIGHGKTTLMDMIAVKIMAQAIGTETETYEMRLWADNIRKLHGEIELERLAHFFDSEVIDANQRLNPLAAAYDLSPSMQLSFLLGMLEKANEQRLTGYMPYALRVLIYHLHEDFKGFESIELLRDLADGADEDTERSYRDAQKLDVSQMSKKQQAMLAKPSNFNSEAWREDCFKLYMLLDSICSKDGLFEGRFGGDASTAEVMTKQRANIVDMSDTGDMAIAQMQEFFWLVRQTASKKQNRDFMFNVELHDENWKLWQYESYARAMFQHIKQIRSEETLIIVNNHKPSDYETVGDEGSIQSQMATKMVSDVGIWAIGKQEPEDASVLASKIGLTPTEQLKTTKLKKGHWGFKVGDERVVWIDTRPAYNKYVNDLSFSNQALRTLLKKGKAIDKALAKEAA